MNSNCCHFSVFFTNSVLYSEIVVSAFRTFLGRYMRRFMNIESFESSGEIVRLNASVFRCRPVIEVPAVAVHYYSNAADRSRRRILTIPVRIERQKAVGRLAT